MGIHGIDHIAFRTPDVEGLRSFYAELLGAESIEGDRIEHRPLRVGGTILVFFEADSTRPAWEDEIAFDCDATGLDEAYERARLMGAVDRELAPYTPWSRGFLARDPDGRRLDFVHNDEGVYWQE